MKKIFIYIFIFFASINVYAQRNHKQVGSFGVKAGLNHSTFIYTDKNLKPLPNNIFIRPDLGVYVEAFINDNLSLAPEVFLYNKGNLTTYVYENNYDVTYKVKTRYLTTRLPLYYYFQTYLKSESKVRPFVRTEKSIKLFLVCAPSIDYLLGGNISLTQPGLPINEVNINVGKANMHNIDFSMFIGCGYSFINSEFISKIELGYNFGLINSYSEMEKIENSQSTNIHAYNITGKRFNRNIELNVSFGIPIKVKKKDTKDACNGSYNGFQLNNKRNTYNNKAQKSKNKRYMGLVY